MEDAEGILLPVLLVAIIVNTVILVVVVFVTRGRERVSPAATRSVLQGSLLSTSFVDQAARSSWPSNGESVGAAGVVAGAAIDAASSDAGDASEGGEGEDVPVLAADATPEPEPEPEDTTMTTEPETNGVDALTGLLDQGTFTRLVVAENLRIHRYHRPATVVIFELGGLDRLVDRLGPEAADRIIPALADTMRRLARDVDHVARLAPGRFGVLLPETDEIAAINYVERVRRACELWLESGAIALTLAAGWAGTDDDPTLVESHRLATDRMYAELRREERRAPDL